MEFLLNNWGGGATNLYHLRYGTLFLLKCKKYKKTSSLTPKQTFIQNPQIPMPCPDINHDLHICL